MAVRIKESAEAKLGEILQHETMEFRDELRDIDNATLGLVDVAERSGTPPDPNLQAILELTSRLKGFADELVARASGVRQWVRFRYGE